IHAGAPLVAPKAFSIRHFALLIAALLYVVVSYPYQAVIFPLFGSVPQAAYAVFAVAGIGLALCFRGSHLPLGYGRVSLFAISLLTACMLVTLAIYRTPTVVRDLLLLALLAVIVFRVKGEPFLQIIRA